MSQGESFQERIFDAEWRRFRWLDLGNSWAAKGYHEEAEKCYAESKYWLELWNKLTNQH